MLGSELDELGTLKLILIQENHGAAAPHALAGPDIASGWLEQVFAEEDLRDGAATQPDACQKERGHPDKDASNAG